MKTLFLFATLALSTSSFSQSNPQYVADFYDDDEETILDISVRFSIYKDIKLGINDKGKFSNHIYSEGVLLTVTPKSNVHGYGLLVDYDRILNPGESVDFEIWMDGENMKHMEGHMHGVSHTNGVDIMSHYESETQPGAFLVVPVDSKDNIHPLFNMPGQWNIKIIYTDANGIKQEKVTEIFRVD